VAVAGRSVGRRGEKGDNQSIWGKTILDGKTGISST